MDVLTENPTERATIWRAKLETPNFVFEAFGATANDAYKAMDEGLRIHGEQFNMPDNWWYGYYECFAATRVIVLGQCYRDGDPLRGRAQPRGV